MVHLILNDEEQPIGWKLEPKTEEEQKIAAIIRDLQFFGLEMKGTDIKYNGITLIDKEKGKTLGNLKSVEWKQSKYSDFS